MVQINFALKEVNCKIVYYGPGMSGKTTNLEIVHQKAPEENKGDLTSISTDGDRTLFFDFMPLDLGNVAGMRTKFQLYTVPGQVYYNSTRKLVLQGVDGVIFIADSDSEKMAENIESYENLIENLEEYGKDVRELPHVIQYNKRDHPRAMAVEEIDRQMNRFGVPTFEAVAVTGEGVFPTLKVLAGMVLESIDRTDNRRSRGGAAAPRQRAAAGAAAAAGGGPAAGEAPHPPRRAPRQSPADVAGRATPRPSGPAKRRPPAGRQARQAAAGPARRRPAAAGQQRPRGAGRPSPSTAVAAAVRGRAAKPKRGMGLVVSLTVVLAAAIAGVVYFVMNNNGL